jgi:hypothetical protein
MKMSGQLHATAALSRGKSSRNHWIRCLVGARAGMNAVTKKNPTPAENRTLVVQSIVKSFYRLSRFGTPSKII